MISDIIFEPIEKAIKSLEKAINADKNEFTRDAAIHRFEYSYELCWKLLKRCLKEFYGIDEPIIKNIYREAAKNKIIESPEPWFKYHTSRNLTSHTYNGNNAEEVYEAAKLFLVDAKILIEKLKKIQNAAQ